MLVGQSVTCSSEEPGSVGLQAYRWAMKHTCKSKAGNRAPTFRVLTHTSCFRAVSCFSCVSDHAMRLTAWEPHGGQIPWLALTLAPSRAGCQRGTRSIGLWRLPVTDLHRHTTWHLNSHTSTKFWCGDGVDSIDGVRRQHPISSRTPRVADVKRCPVLDEPGPGPGPGPLRHGRNVRLLSLLYM